MRIAPLALSLLVIAACRGEEPEPEPEPWVEPPVAPEAEPERIAATDGWLIGLLQNPANDVVLDAIEAGEFTWPRSGTTDENGTSWTRITPDDSGQLGRYPASSWYAIAPVETQAGERYFVRTQRAGRAFVGRKQQPGHVYADSRPAVPLVPREDDDLIVLRGRANFPMAAQLYKTTDEAYFNFNDAAVPDLVHGRATEQWYGVPVLNLTGGNLTPLYAKVIESEWWEASEIVHPSIGADVNTQIAFQLIPKKDAPTPPEGAPAEEWERVPLTLRISSPGLEWSYERTVELPTQPPTSAYWRTFRSPIDGSVQRYGVRDPSNFDATRDYALFLSLHGAGVQGRGQAAAVSAKDWAYVISPTNRHEFGFDWEEWGRFNALASLDHAMDTYNIDPTQVYLGGHSMGGHGTWHVGVTTPGRFATLNPSAGWESFYSYSGSARPGGAFARSRAHSDTLVYLENLERRGVYVIHGDADTNVPFREGVDMHAAASEVTEDVRNHWEPGAGHWWDGYPEPGAACVDWPDAMAWMQERRLDPTELTFRFRSPNPGYSPTHSYVTVRSAASMYEDFILESEPDADDEGAVVLSTTNVRSLELDAEALQAKGIDRVVVDGEEVDVSGGETVIVGPEDGKNHNVYGSFNQAFRRPYCYVYAEDEDTWADAAAFHTSTAQLVGRGHACGVPLSELTDEIRDTHNLIYVGVDADTVGAPFGWSWERDISLGQAPYGDALLYHIFPRDSERLDAVMTTSAGDANLLFRVPIWSSRSGLPDYFVWKETGTVTAGFFTADWEYVPGQ